jgi:PAS domain S-box-containing protein
MTQETSWHFRMETCSPLLEFLPTPVCAMNLDGGLRFVNSAFAELLGVQPSEALILPLWERASTPEEREACKRKCERILAASSNSDKFQCCLSKHDGTTVHVEASWKHLESPEGELCGALCTLIDITEHVTATRALAEREQELRDAHAELSRVLETISDYVWSLQVDEQGKVRRHYFSPVVERITGRAHREYCERGFDAALETVYPEDRERVSRWLQELRNTGCSGQIEYRIRKTDGSSCWLRDSAVANRFADGSLSLFGVATDITDRRKAEDARIGLESKIQQAQKLESLGVLAGGIAHDFNNLLVGMLGNAELAMMELAPESPARDYVRNIVATAKRASDLVRQMLAYSGKGRFVIERIELGAIVEEMVHLLQISVSRKVVLKLDVARPVPPVEADATQLRQVVMSLVTNASEAIGDRSGVVQISTGVLDCDQSYLKESYLDDNLPEGPYSYIEVSDTGTGMEDGTRARIFDPFFTTKFTGRGLGLAAVLGIIRGHRGAIKVYTEVGKGSSFKVLLPVADPKLPKTDPLPSLSSPGKSTSHAHVLLVDDEPTVRSVGKAILEKLGYTVTCACDGREALAIFKESPDAFDCVLLDLTMPHMDGEQAFRELRRIRKDIPVLLSSGYNEQDLIGRFAGKGLAGFIQKPYRVETLARQVKDVLG